MPPTIEKEHERLLGSKEFKGFHQGHPDAYLAHAFIMSDNDQWSEWQFGYYLKDKDEVVSFIMEDRISATSPQEIFKKDKRSLGMLELEKVNHSLDEATEKGKALVKEKYPGEVLSKIIVIIQVVEQGQVFNLTFISMSFNIINVRLSTTDLELKHLEKRSLMELGKTGGKAS